MKETKYKNLLFDLGGVIIDLKREDCVAAFEELGMSDANEQFGQYSQQGIFLALEEGRLGVDEFHAEVRRIMSVEVTDDEIDAAFCKFLVGIPKRRLRALEELRKHYNIYMLSNTNPIHMEQSVKEWFKIDGKDINHYFDGLSLSYEAKSAKPNREIFEYTVSHLCIKPEETLFLDDSDKNLKAASELGFGVALVEEGKEFTDVLEHEVGFKMRGPKDMIVVTDKDELHEGGLLATIGMFDGVHLGHRFLIKDLTSAAKQLGVKSAVITFSNHPQRVFNPDGGLRMIMTLEERLRILDELGVDVAIVLDFTKEFAKIDSSEFMNMLRSKYEVGTLIMGFNHRFGCNRDEDFEDYVRNGEKLGIVVVKADEYQGEYSPVSSSLIRKMLEEGRVDLAKAYLTQPFYLEGVVVPGKQNGRKIGFPTANLDVASELIVPHRGVYAVRVTLPDGTKRGGMANIGVRPTIEKGGKRTFEVNIFDFDGDLYGKTLRVGFVKFMRSEMKMGSFDELKERLKLDALACRKVLG